MPTTEQKLLLAASEFIRNHPNGTDDLLKELMADAVKKAANMTGPPTISGTWPIPKIKFTLPEAPRTDAPMATDADFAAMMRGKGYQSVKGASLEVMRLLWADPSREWTPQQVAKKLRRGSATNAVLRTLASRGVIAKPSTGVYKAL